MMVTPVLSGNNNKNINIINWINRFIDVTFNIQKFAAVSHDLDNIYLSLTTFVN